MLMSDSRLRAVVVAAGNNDDLYLGDGVDQAMLSIDSSRPVAAEFVLEWFGLAQPFKGGQCPESA